MACEMEQQPSGLFLQLDLMPLLLEFNCTDIQIERAKSKFGCSFLSHTSCAEEKGSAQITAVQDKPQRFLCLLVSCLVLVQKLYRSNSATVYFRRIEP